VESGFRFEVESGEGEEPKAYIRRAATPSGKSTGLDCGRGVAIALEDPAAVVTIRFTGEPPDGVVISARQRDQRAATVTLLPNPQGPAWDARIEGRDIVQVAVRVRGRGSAILQSICAYRATVGPSTIQISALFGDGVVARTEISGRPGQVVRPNSNPDGSD